jgi:hypothetical protein
LDADRRQLSALVEEAGHADDGVCLEQQQRVRRIIKIDPAVLDGGCNDANRAAD